MPLTGGVVGCTTAMKVAPLEVSVPMDRRANSGISVPNRSIFPTIVPNRFQKPDSFAPRLYSSRRESALTSAPPIVRAPTDFCACTGWKHRASLLTIVRCRRGLARGQRSGRDHDRSICQDGGSSAWLDIFRRTRMRSELRLQCHRGAHDQR
jgi:hypothetical protein